MNEIKFHRIKRRDCESMKYLVFVDRDSVQILREVGEANCDAYWRKQTLKGTKFDLTNLEHIFAFKEPTKRQLKTCQKLYDEIEKAKILEAL